MNHQKRVCGGDNRAGTTVAGWQYEWQLQDGSFGTPDPVWAGLLGHPSCRRLQFSMGTKGMGSGWGNDAHTWLHSQTLEKSNSYLVRPLQWPEP